MATAVVSAATLLVKITKNDQLMIVIVVSGATAVVSGAAAVVSAATSLVKITKNYQLMFVMILKTLQLIISSCKYKWDTNL